MLLLPTASHKRIEQSKRLAEYDSQCEGGKTLKRIHVTSLRRTFQVEGLPKKSSALHSLEPHANKR